MDITFRASENLCEDAILTFNNMRSYYEQYGVKRSKAQSKGGATEYSAVKGIQDKPRR